MLKSEFEAAATPPSPPRTLPLLYLLARSPLAVPVSVDLGLIWGMVERQKDFRVIISMMVLCNVIVIIDYDRRRRSGLSSAPLDIEYDKKHKHRNRNRNRYRYRKSHNSKQTT